MLRKAKFFTMIDFDEIINGELFKGCDNKAVEKILKEFSFKESLFEPGDFVAMQDSVCSSLYLLAEGRVLAKMTSAEGKEITIDYLKSPNILAPAFIYGSKNYFPVSLQAETHCRLYTLSREGFFKIMESDAAVLRNFLRIISDRSFFLSRKLNEFALQNLTERIITYLKFRGKISNVQDVAFIFGVARPSLSRAISMLAEKGIIKKTDEGYVLR